MAKPELVPTLWYAENAEEAAKFYTSLLPDSKINSVRTMLGDSPGGKEGSIQIVEFTLLGRPMSAFNAKPMSAFNYSISFMIMCDTQGEIDKYSKALSKGGSQEPCGWAKDRWGLSWQIVPRVMAKMMKDPNKKKARAVTKAMMGMKKLDIAKLKAAYKNS